MNEKGTLERDPVFGIMGRYNRQALRINAITVAIEAMSDGAHQDEISRDSLDINHYMAGVLIGNEFLLDKFIFGQRFGIYVYDPYKRNALPFQRHWLDFTFCKLIYIGIALKTHRHASNFLVFRLGVPW